MNRVVLDMRWPLEDEYWSPTSTFTWKWIQSIACLYPIHNTRGYRAAGMKIKQWSLLLYSISTEDRRQISFGRVFGWYNKNNIKERNITDVCKKCWRNKKLYLYFVFIVRYNLRMCSTMVSLVWIYNAIGCYILFYRCCGNSLYHGLL